MKSIWLQRRIGVVLLCAAAVLVLSATQPSCAGIIDYSRSLAEDFKATFPGGDPGAGAPTSNPFGDWEFRGPNGLASDLTAVPGGIPASGQPGWCTGSAGACDGSPLYSYSGTEWQPGVTIDPRVLGHGPHDVLWTAPANFDAPAVDITGSIEQIFEPARVQRLSVFKNDSASPFATIDSQPPIVGGVILQRVDFGPVGIAVAPGDTLRFFIDGSGEGGDGALTFVAWDVRVTAIPEPSSTALVLLGIGTLLPGLRRHLI